MSREDLKMDSIIGFPYMKLYREAQIHLNAAISYTNHFQKRDKVYSSHSVALVAKYKLLCDPLDRPYDERIVQHYKAI